MKNRAIELRKKLTAKVCKMYGINICKNDFYIHTPEFISFDVDDLERIEENEYVFRFVLRQNVIISIWKKVVITHTSILTYRHSN